MSNTIIATVLIAGAVGAGSAVAVNALSPAPETTTTQAIAPGSGSSDLVEQVAALQKQNEELTNRILELEMTASTPRAETREAVAVGPDPELEKLKADLASIMASIQKGPDNVTPAFTASVSAALEDIREKEDAEREAKRAERRAERIDDRIASISEKLGLTPAQGNDLREHYNVFEEKRNALMAEARESGDWGNMRETFRGLRDESNTALQTILTPSQYDQYQEENMGGGRRGGFGGGGGGNDGGGGGGGGGRRGGRGF